MRWWSCLCFAVSLAGCLGDQGAGPEALGHTVAEINLSPPGVQCIAVEVAWDDGGVVSRQASFPPGSSGRIDLGVLRGGVVTLRGMAYDTPCEGGLLPSSGTPSGTPTWIAAPRRLTLAPNTFQNLPLVFQPNSPTTAEPDFRVPVRSLGAGGNTSFAVMADGSVRAWGANGSAQTGIGLASHSVRRPAMVRGLRGASFVQGGSQFACALESSRVLCWGDNSRGQLGNGLVGGRVETPEAISGLPAATALSVGAEHACALSLEGDPQVLCWGDNRAGQLGTFSSTPLRAVPRTIAAGAFTAVAVGASETCMLLGTGAVLCQTEVDPWLPTAPRAPTTTLRTLPGTFDAISVGRGRVCGVSLTGQVECLGVQTRGSLEGSLRLAPIPSGPVAGLSDVARVVSGLYFTCALKTDGTVWCFGNTWLPVLADPTRSLESNVARPVDGLVGVTDLVAGDAHACALRRDGTVWCWGDNLYGQLGDDTLMNRFRPVQVQF